MSDQAAGLRRWAQERVASGDEAPDETVRSDDQPLADAAANASDDPATLDPSEASTPEPTPEPQPELKPEPESEPESESEPEPSPTIPLMVLGLPKVDGIELAQAALVSWSRQGKRWVGDPAAWQVVACDAHSPRLAQLASQEKRWALWVETDGDGFRQAFNVMRAVRRGGGPRRMLALHPPVASRRGLLNNLQQMAREAFDIDLLVLAP